MKIPMLESGWHQITDRFLIITFPPIPSVRNIWLIIIKIGQRLLPPWGQSPYGPNNNEGSVSDIEPAKKVKVPESETSILVSKGDWNEITRTWPCSRLEILIVCLFHDPSHGRLSNSDAFVKHDIIVGYGTLMSFFGHHRFSLYVLTNILPIQRTLTGYANSSELDAHHRQGTYWLTFTQYPASHQHP